MDTQKKQHQVAWVHPETGEIQKFSVANTPREIERMARKIRPQTPGEIHVCYEAGVCGFVLQRQFQKLGCMAKVIALSLVLRKPGERRRPGGITKTGNRRVRRILTETAWHYRHPHRVGKAPKDTVKEPMKKH